jgi:raffinose/stachyose/melibiose transport system permease protein
MPSVMAVEVWRMSGYCMVIFLAGLKVIPQNLFEAADIDGASAVQKFFKITLPFLQPSISINVILNLIWGLKVFDLIFVLTRGGPGYATGVLNTAVFFEYSSGRYGMATALGVVIFVITSIIALLVLRVLNRNTVELA